MSVVIVDYGMGNLRSVRKAFQRIGCNAEVSAAPEAIRRAERIVLPGVGHFARGMQNLQSRDLLPALESRVRQDGVPFLGICLGLQLLSESSEEGDCAGLGWIAARTVRFAFEDTGSPLKVPHIGWNTLQNSAPRSLLPPQADNASFYFSHSYHLHGCDPEIVVAVSSYGHDFPAAIHQGNIFATQFHPEKSHGRGLEILRRFVEGV